MVRGGWNVQLVDPSVQTFVLEQSLSTTAGQIVVKFTVDIHDPQRIIPNATSDPLTLVFPSSRYFHLYTKYVKTCWQIAVKFILCIFNTPLAVL